MRCALNASAADRSGRIWGHPESVIGGISVEAYCLKCRASREVSNPEQVTLKNGRPATRGRCSVCNASVFRIGKATA